MHSNTTLVKVKLNNLDTIAPPPNKFKYNTC